MKVTPHFAVFEPKIRRNIPVFGWIHGRITDPAKTARSAPLTFRIFLVYVSLQIVLFDLGVDKKFYIPYRSKRRGIFPNESKHLSYIILSFILFVKWTRYWFHAVWINLILIRFFPSWFYVGYAIFKNILLKMLYFISTKKHEWEKGEKWRKNDVRVFRKMNSIILTVKYCPLNFLWNKWEIVLDHIASII